MPATQTKATKTTAKPGKLRAPEPPASAASMPAIPPGYALVPTRLTKPMKLAAQQAEVAQAGTDRADGLNAYTAIWKAMLAAVPVLTEAAAPPTSTGHKRKG